MRKIGTIQDEGQALLFVDYLVSRGIRSQAEPSASGGWAVWVYEEGQIDEGERELERFAANPAAAEYASARGAARRQQRETERDTAAWRKNMVDARTSLWRSRALEGGVATYGLIALSIAASVLAFFPETQGVRQWLTIASYRTIGGMVLSPGLAEILHGQVWRLVTPIFLHFGILHLLFNMLWLKQLGGEIEARRGTAYLLAMVATFAVLSNVGQYFASGPMFGGMSGVVYGLFGFVWMCVKYMPGTPYYLERNTVYLMVGWFFLCVFGVIPHVANTAHAVGLVTGIVWGCVTARRIPFTQIRF